MTVPTSDSDYLREAQAARKHEAQLAQIEADKQVKLAQQRTADREMRRPFIGAVLIGLAVVVVALAIIVAIVWNVRDDRAARERDRQRSAEVARTCIEAGNIWANGDCLIARRPS